MRKEDQPVRELIAEIARDTGALVEQEIRLAKTELSQNISRANTGISSAMSGGIVLLAGALVLLQALVIGVAEALRPVTSQYIWLAPLIVGLIVAIVGVVLLQRGRHKLAPENLARTRTLTSLQRERDYLREQYK